MKSLGVAALVVIAGWCASCESVGAQAPETAPAAVNPAQANTPPAGESKPETKPETTSAPTNSDSSNEQAIVNEASAANAHLSTPGGETATTSYPALRQFLDDSQNAHDKMIVDRFLIGVAIIFAVIAAALYFSLPPKRREQKE